MAGAAGALDTSDRPTQASPPCATSTLYQQFKSVYASLDGMVGYIRIDVVGKVLQGVSVERGECRVVLCQFEALVVGVRVVLDLAVGDLGNVVESVAMMTHE